MSERNVNAYFGIDERNKLSFSKIVFALILQLHEKHFYHLDGSKQVIECLKITT